MTRDEAIKKVNMCGGNRDDMLVDGLVQLGLLHLETTEDKVRLAAVERLTGVFVRVDQSAFGNDASKYSSCLSQDGALEILDVLTKSGFRITRTDAG